MKLYADKDAPRDTGDLQFELEQWIEVSPFEDLLGITIEHAQSGSARLSLPYTVKLSNGGGVMHGGAMTTLADTAVAMAIKSLLPPGTRFATTSLEMKFLSPVIAGKVTAKARTRTDDGYVYRGDCELCGEHGQLYAKFSAVFKVPRR
jgi:uncharacterized protein (TIGR00369 family)